MKRSLAAKAALCILFAVGLLLPRQAFAQG
jgi:hypothetical protein